MADNSKYRININTVQPESAHSNRSTIILFAKKNHQLKQRTQHVWTIAQRARAIKWMNETAESEVETHIASKDVRRFHLLFCRSTNADLRRSVWLWKDRHKYDKVGQLVDSV